MRFVSTFRDCLKRRVIWLATAAAVAVLPFEPMATHAVEAAPPQARQSGDVFRTRTDLVVLQVTVVDGHGKAVPDLRMEDFAIFEEGVRQPVALFDTATAPLDLMLLLDTSASMIGRMDAARAAALELVHRSRADDRTALILFSDEVKMAQTLTGDVASLEAAIRSAWAAGGTALHEALYIGLRELVRAHAPAREVRRQALVVLSDGEDTTSRSVLLDDVVDAARRSAVTVFTIMPATRTAPDPVQRIMRNGAGAAFNLRALANETGGRAFAPARAEDLSATYQQIADELGHQYWLAYTPTTAGSGFRRVAVQIVSQPQLRARTRSGYVATGPRVSQAQTR